MKLLYIGTELCPPDTLQRLMVLADEICFLDRPSVMFDDGQWGTIGHDTPMRRFTTGSETIKFSCFRSPTTAEAGEVYQHYARADVLNPEFVRAFLDGLRDSVAFSNRYVQPQGNYGTDISGVRLRQLLV